MSSNLQSALGQGRIVPPPLAELEELLDVTFADSALLQRAFVHRSYLNELLDNNQELSDNERLEFLGDAVLGYIVSQYLFQEYPNLNEGDLTNLRSALVRRETLARVASDLGLGDYLLLGHGEEESGGRDRPATLCATFEALVGAIYLDQGIEPVRAVVFRMLSEDLEQLRNANNMKDAKSRLQEWAQAALGATPRYKVVESSGPDHAKHFVMLVLVAGEPRGVGDGRSKQESAQKAAAMALYRAGEEANEYVPSLELEQKHGFHPI